MTKQQYLEAIIPVIQKACYGLFDCTKSLVICGKIPCKNIEHYKPITLEHVLEAISQYGGIPHIEGVSPKENYYNTLRDFIFGKWSFGTPLEQQDEQTLQFIHSVLCEGK